MTAPANSPARGGSIGRFIVGDPMRALAAIVVICFHTSHAVLNQAQLRDPTKAFGPFVGHLAITSQKVIFVFFCGSGYLLGRPFIRAFVLNRRPPPIASFARNRFARIVPACLAAITVTLLVRGVGDSTLPQVLAVYGLVQNYVPSQAQVNVIHIWSVDVEALFYVLLPLCALALGRIVRGRGTPRLRLGITFVLLGLIMVVSIRWLAMRPLDENWQRQLPAVAFSIAVGMALGALEIPAVAWAPRLRRPALIGGCVFAAGWAVLLFTRFSPTHAGAIERGISIAVGCGLVFGGPLLQQWAGAGALRIIDNRALQAIGRWSYSIYLFHLVVLYEVTHHVHVASPKRELALVILPVLAGSVALGALSFQLIEKPMMRFRGISTQPTTEPQRDPPNLPPDAAPHPEHQAEPLPAPQAAT